MFDDSLHLDFFRRLCLRSAVFNTMGFQSHTRSISATSSSFIKTHSGRSFLVTDVGCLPTLSKWHALWCCWQRVHGLPPPPWSIGQNRSATSQGIDLKLHFSLCWRQGRHLGRRQLALGSSIYWHVLLTLLLPSCAGNQVHEVAFAGPYVSWYLVRSLYKIFILLMK